jgi:hypothetical protein
VNQRGFLSLGLYVVIALGAATLIAGGVASCEHKGKIRAQEDAARIQGQFDGFVAQVKQRGEEAQREADEEKARQARVLTERSKAYEVQLAKLRADKRTVDRVLQHYIAGAGSRAVPAIPPTSDASGSGCADTVAPYRGALEKLTREAAETTLMFNECRDTWKSLK